MSDETPSPSSLDEVIARILEAQERGERADLRSWIERYPEHESELRQFLSDADLARAELQRPGAGDPNATDDAATLPEPGRPLDADGTNYTPPTDDSATRYGEEPSDEHTRYGDPANESAAIVWGEGGRVRYFGEYELIRELGQGGMGVVYLARQRSLGRIVALKMILERGHESQTAADRFRREASAIAKLDHPNIIRLFEFDRFRGRWYFTMEFLAGGSLSERIAEEPLEPAHAARLVAGCARGIAAAHAAGILHRDLKPGNILLAADGSPRVADFGLAKSLDDDDDGSDRTDSEARIGTPAYMAPEQTYGAGRVRDLSDVYGLGAILYAGLTGKAPFAGRKEDLFLRVREEDPIPPRLAVPSVPRDLETICLKCLHKQPQKRYLSAAALADDLDRYLRGEPILARPVSVAERVVRWVRRHPTWTALIALMIAIPIGLTWFSLVLAERNEELRRETAKANAASTLAERESQRATAEATFARENASFLESCLGSNDVIGMVGIPLIERANPGGGDITVKDVLKTTLPRIDAIEKSQPRLAGRLLLTIGSAYLFQGRVGEGKTVIERAHRLIEANASEEDEPLRIEADLRLAFVRLVWLREREAAQLADGILVSVERVRGKSLSAAERESLTLMKADARVLRGLLALMSQRFNDGERDLDEAWRILQEAKLTDRRANLEVIRGAITAQTRGDVQSSFTTLVKFQSRPELAPLVTVFLARYSIDHYRGFARAPQWFQLLFANLAAGNDLVLPARVFPDRRSRFNHVREHYEKKLLPFVDRMFPKDSLLSSMQLADYGTLLLQIGDYRAAERIVDELLERGKSAPDHPMLQYVHGAIGKVRWEAGDSDLALAHYEKAVRLSSDLPSMITSNRDHRRGRFKCLLELGRYRDADAALSEGRGKARWYHDFPNCGFEDSWYHEVQELNGAGIALGQYSEADRVMLIRLNDVMEAATLAERLRLLRESGRAAELSEHRAKLIKYADRDIDDPKFESGRFNGTEIQRQLFRIGARDRVRKLLVRAGKAADDDPARPEEHPSDLSRWSWWVDVELAEGKPEAALIHAERAVRIAEASLFPTDTRRVQALVDRARVLSALKRPVAEAALDAALDAVRKMRPRNSRRAGLMLDTAILLRTRGRTEPALALLREALTTEDRNVGRSTIRALDLANHLAAELIAANRPTEAIELLADHRTTRTEYLKAEHWRHALLDLRLAEAALQKPDPKVPAPAALKAAALEALGKQLGPDAETIIGRKESVLVSGVY